MIQKCSYKARWFKSGCDRIMKLIRNINNRKRRIHLNYMNALAFNGGGKKAAMSWAMRSVKPNLNYLNHLAKRASNKFIKEHTPPFIYNS